MSATERAPQPVPGRAPGPTPDLAPNRNPDVAADLAPDLAIDARGLGKRYGDTRALNGFDLAVQRGTVHALLGPNGAGKTTAVRMLATLVRIEVGRAVVAGFDVHRQPEQVKARIGLIGQDTAVDDVLTGRQNLVMFGRLHHLPIGEGVRRAGQLLAQFGLEDAADRAVRTYSGGMRRRLDLAASLVLAPEVLFLDEPTTGLDPASRNDVWEAVRGLVAGGTTVLLTTQYLDEADQLADRVAVLAAGRVIAEGTPDQLKARVGGDHLDVVVAEPDLTSAALGTLERLGHTDVHGDPRTGRITMPVHERVATVGTVINELAATGVELADLELRRPTLDDVFLHLTDTPTSPSDAANATTRTEVPA